MIRLTLRSVILGLLIWSAGTMAIARSADDAVGVWIGTWGAPADQAGRALKEQTLRQIIRTSIGGSKLRIRLSNLYGAGPVTIGPVRVGRSGGGSAIHAGTDRPLTFGGKSSVTIPKGADALSDPVALPVRALEELAVSLYVPAAIEASTIHGVAMQTAYLAPGDVTAAEKLATAETDDSRFFLTDVDVEAPADARSLVIVGDSVTDGVGSTDDRNARWPDALAARLQGDPALASIAVINAGIAGNRILNDGGERFIGPSTLSRFDRDALNKPGVRWVLLLQGINDISASSILKTPKDNVSAEQIIEGMKTLIARAHAKGIQIWGGTLLPRKGVAPPFNAPENEVKRAAVNAWIRNSGAFDAVIDFEAVVRDLDDPDRMRPAFDSGDHRHPNDAGYKAMAAALDQTLFARRR
jgi:lysophospholipase L1-like esterase